MRKNLFRLQEKKNKKNKQLKRISTIDPPTDFLEGKTGDTFQLDGTTGEEIVLVLSQNKIICKAFPRMITPPQTPQTGVPLEILIGEIGKALPLLMRIVSPLKEIPTSTSIRRDTLT